MSEEKFDVIVVGAGPAGTSAALTAAKGGLNVVLLERGEYPGAKNVQGAILYTKMLADVVPEFWKDPQCPLERPIVEQNFFITTDDSFFKVGYRSEKWLKEPHNCYSIIRVHFDQWYAKKAEEAGAQLFSGVKVSKLLVKDGRINGIETSEGDQLLADVVIACDGVNSMLAQSAGLIDEWKAEEVALGVKEILQLPRSVIEDRFCLEGNAGSTIEMFGHITKGILGYVFLYTNKDSLAFGVGGKLSDFQKSGLKPYELLEMAKSHPAVRRYVKDAKPLEYSAHLIPEGGFTSMPPLYTDGFLIAGDAAQMINPFHREGSNLAMASGRMAGETAIEAKKRGDFSKRTLCLYQEKIEKSFIYSDLKALAGLESMIEKNPRYFQLYPQILSDAMFRFFSVDGRPKKTIRKDILLSLWKKPGFIRLAWDMWRLRHIA